MTYDVACIGILVTDVIAKPVDSIPAPGLLERIDGIETFTGGCAMSAGIDMAKIGLKTAVLGKVGNDSFGEFLKKALVEYNVCVDGLAVDDKVQTSASIVLSASNGERTFLHCVGANGTFCLDDINWDVIKASKIVFVAGTMLMDAFDGQPCADFLKKCKEMGKITVLDTAWDAKNRWMSVLAPCMPFIDVFLPSIDEAAALSGKTELDDIADVFFDNGVKQVAIKNGKHGCYLRESKSAAPVLLETYKSAPVVDTTGAGDSFCAGFITGLAKDLPFTECGMFANAVGTFCVGAKGATTGISDYDTIRRYMNEHTAG